MKLTFGLFIIASVLSFGFIEDIHKNAVSEVYPPYYTNSKPYTRWWWFASDIKKEDVVSNLKMVVDALFANGVNQIIWHGKPFNPKGEDTIKFYASVHIGQSSPMADEIPAFNNYMEKVSSFMKEGETYSRVAVYLPLEDSWTTGKLPREKQFIWALKYI